MKPPPTCNWLHVRAMTRCGKPVVAMIHEAGYCHEHVRKAESMFGKGIAVNLVDSVNGPRNTLGAEPPGAER